MTKESGPQPPQTEPAADTDRAAGAASRLTDAGLGTRDQYAAELDLWYGRKSPESEALDKAAAEHKAYLVNALMSAFTPEERAALDNCLAGGGSPLDAAKLLRHRPEIVETWPLPDTESVRTIRGLVRLSDPDAFALVESGRVPVDQAALVGHCVRNVFAHQHPPQVCDDFQMRAMTRLAEGKPVSAERAKYFANPIEEVANDVLNEQKAEHRHLDCERIWNEPYWSVWTVLSWIAFRDVAWLCEIEDERSSAGVKSYGVKHYGPSLKQAAPESLLLAALKNDELRAIRSGAELQAIYWADKIKVDCNTWFRQKSVRRCWPGPGEETYGDIEELAADAKGLSLRRARRTQRADRFNRKQARIALGKRRWLRLSEIADECARRPGSLAVDDKKRERALEELRCSILTGDFVDNQARSRVLNMHPSPLAHFRFEPSAAANAERFNSIAWHLWIRDQDCTDWFDRLGLDLPHRLREPWSTVPGGPSRAEPAQSPPTPPLESKTVIGPLGCTNIETARVPQAGKFRPKGPGEKKADAIEAAKCVAADWLKTHRWLLNKKEHHRLTMNRLKDEWPGNHLMSTKVKELIDNLDPVKEFGARRRDVGRYAR